MSLDQDVKQQIEKDLAQHKVMLYMKGTPDSPQCGFSAKVIELLKTTGVPFGTQDVLADEDLRAGIKEFANWPTIPQLYVGGELIGGCDIIVEMAEKGELKPRLEQS